MDDEDFALALQLDEELNRESKTSQNDSKAMVVEKPLSIVDPSWELIDPIPDIRELFVQFNGTFFNEKLAGVEVKWSSRMTLCAGVCCYEGRGGLCCIKLSQPLLKLRPRKDMVETLLHEMIHALLFVTDNNKDHDGHGPEFHKHMHRINNETGTNISVYHSFHDEVDVYRTHWWRCNGPCVKRPPFFGIVRRTMNRAPAPRDTWWNVHQNKCGGEFIKIKEPEDYGAKKRKEKDSDNKSSSKPNDSKNVRDIKDFFKAKETDNNTIKGNINTVYGNSNTIQGTKKGDSNTTKKQKNENEIYQSSSNSSSSNIFGFKMSANKKPQLTNTAASFSGAGLKTGRGSCSSNTSSSNGSGREQFLKNLEKTIVNNTISNKSTDQKRKRDDNTKTAINTISEVNDKYSTNKSTKPTSKIIKITDVKPLHKKLKTIPIEDEIKYKNGSRAVTVVDNNEKRTTNNDVIHIADDNSFDFPVYQGNLIDCPACPAKVPEHELNAHLDTCLA